MDEPPKYMSLTHTKSSKLKHKYQNLSITPSKSPSITPVKSKFHQSPSLRSNKSQNRENNEFFGNLFLNQSYPLKPEAHQKSRMISTPNKPSKNESLMLSINQVDDSGSKNLLYQPTLCNLKIKFREG
jgi:ubiquitin-protein ligase